MVCWSSVHLDMMRACVVVVLVVQECLLQVPLGLQLPLSRR